MILSIKYDQNPQQIHTIHPLWSKMNCGIFTHPTINIGAILSAFFFFFFYSISNVNNSKKRLHRVWVSTLKQTEPTHGLKVLCGSPSGE